MRISDCGVLEVYGLEVEGMDTGSSVCQARQRIRAEKSKIYILSVRFPLCIENLQQILRDIREKEHRRGDTETRRSGKGEREMERLHDREIERLRTDLTLD
jgi:hypothetical protein